MLEWVMNVLFILAGATIGMMFSSLMTISKVEEERISAYKRGFKQGEIYGITKEKGRSKKHHHEHEKEKVV